MNRVLVRVARRAAAARLSTGRRCGWVQPLEARRLLATFVVTSAGDGGPGTLRDAIEQANATPEPDDVRFNIPGDGPVRTLRPLSALPAIIAPLTIDGRSLPGNTAAPVIELDGSLAGPAANGLTVSAPQTRVWFLCINRFDGHGIAVTGAAPLAGTGANIAGNYIGTDPTGTVALGNRGAGVLVAAAGVTVGGRNVRGLSRNVISGNGFAGVWVAPTTQGGAAGTRILGNHIGTNAAGDAALGNGREGVLIEDGGGVTLGEQSPFLGNSNVISGNGGSGVRVVAGVGTPTIIVTNYIGVDASGARPLGNGADAALPYRDGITVSGGSVDVGTPVAWGGRAGNVISANAGAGVAVYGGAVQGRGNYIGTDAAGSAAAGNGSDGVRAEGGDAALTVTGNLISGNGGDGVHLRRTRGGTVAGNYIGTDATGRAALGNAGHGVELGGLLVAAAVGAAGSAQPGPLIDPGAARRNVISSNGGHGVYVHGGDGSPAPHRIVNNFIGTDATGAAALGNAGSGVYLAARGVTVGGPNSGSTPHGNLISANGGNGITVVGVPAPSSPLFGNRIEGNFIGVALLLRGPLPGEVGTDIRMGNRRHGVAIFDSANNRVGSADPSGTGANVIAHNGGSGVLVEGGAATSPGDPRYAEGNAISANSIFGNRSMAIDLAVSGEGPTPNDPADADLGPNRLQNHPVLVVAERRVSDARVRYTLRGEPGQTVRIEFFLAASRGRGGRGDGQTYLGFVTRMTDAAGYVEGWFAASSREGHEYVAATATVGGNTSEFSPPVRIGEPPVPSARPPHRPPPRVAEELLQPGSVLSL